MTAGEVEWEQDAAGDLPTVTQMVDEAVDTNGNLAQHGLAVLGVEAEH